MSYQRLEELGGIQWPCPDEQHPGTLFLHARLWEEDPAKRGAPAPFTPVEQEPPVDELSPEFPIRLTTGRRLDSFNTGVQSGKYATPLRRPETLDLSPEDAGRLGLAEGEVAKVSSRRGSLEVPVHIDEVLRAGLAFMTLHFPEQVATNVLTLDAWDPKSGTAEFKATAIRVDKLPAPAPGGDESQRAEVERLVDLRLGAAAQATDEERAAVASVLGPPESGWDGGQRTAADGHVAYGGHAARARRHLLLPVLHAVQERIGWISPGALDHVCARLTIPPAEAYGVASFYALFRTTPSPAAVVHVCDDLACRVNGAERVCEEMERRFGAEGADARSNGSGRHLAAQPLPGPVRPRLGGHDPACGRGTGPGRAGPLRSRAGAGGARARRAQRARPPARPADRGRPVLAPAAAAGGAGRPGLARLLPRGGRVRDAPPGGGRPGRRA